MNCRLIMIFFFDLYAQLEIKQMKIRRSTIIIFFVAIVSFVSNLHAQNRNTFLGYKYSDIIAENRESFVFTDYDEKTKMAYEYRENNNLPANFPAIIILNRDNPAAGKYFLSSRFIGPQSAGTNYMICVDTCGTPVFYQALKNRGSDFRLQPNGYLTHYLGDKSYFVQYDSSYNEMRSYTAGNKSLTDMHELIIEDDGSYWVFTKTLHVIDMSLIVPGGNPQATVDEGVIQHIDLNGNVLFQWNSLDHIDIIDCDPNFVDLTGSYIDYIHVNAMDIDEDGNLLLSSRHLNEITKIDIVTGDIIWRWGGSQNQFTFINDENGFYGQHSIRNHGNGIYTLFDNGNWHSPPRSRGLKYVLDEVNMTATLLYEFTTGNSLSFSAAMGHMQVTDEGSVLLGWAASNYGYVLTDYNNDGERTLDMMNIDTNLISYRAYKYQWETNAFYFTQDTIEFSGGIIPGDSATVIASIYNNTNNEIEISGYHTNDTVFSLTDSFPIDIPANSFYDFQVMFLPTGEDYYSDALTLYSNSHSDSLRIAAQTRLIGNLITLIHESADNTEYLKIVPNPMISNSRISISDDEFIESIRIADCTGRIIYNQQNIHQKYILVDRTMVTSGLFLVDIKTCSKYLRGKLQVW